MLTFIFLLALIIFSFLLRTADFLPTVSKSCGLRVGNDRQKQWSEVDLTTKAGVAPGLGKWLRPVQGCFQFALLPSQSLLQRTNARLVYEWVDVFILRCLCLHKSVLWIQRSYKPAWNEESTRWEELRTVDSLPQFYSKPQKDRDCGGPRLHTIYQLSRFSLGHSYKLPRSFSDFNTSSGLLEIFT